ncbi:type IV pilus modification protein PilV [Pseudoxanthomonas jiangsuensis]|uniref:type IV pilus modification protein PilV n=1 Tax=Pseudoxanthomonas jiangsuensis TaxID=619688 RepID=UPI001391F893|nr:type IV pilus modification protein PilV [Pseudoxanthomonas jiangsuensis]KAF1698309.1 type IV pilus modification protein PilV [Pseudoxanthomonas jiangsuensis]
MNRRSIGRGHGRAGGFSLIEVMIAILVLGVGLLGFALLQTMSVRFTQSANQRTQATNLASDMLDQMRANRLVAAQYAGDYDASTTASECEPDDDISVEKYKTIWECRLGMALGADASARVTFNDGVANVDITWGDQRWNDADNDGTVSDAEKNVSFATETRL